MLQVKDYLADQRVMRSAGAPQLPLVSVILPTYARHTSGRLRRAVESVLAQSFADFELIIVDDGSTDGSEGFIEHCRASDPRVVHVRHELNSGLPALRVNEGIELARGRFLAFQFDDDVWRPDALAALVRGAEQYAKPGVIVGRCLAAGPKEQIIYPDLSLELSYLYERNFIANNSVLVPRQLVDAHGMYDCHIALRRNCDWDLWLRYIRHVPFVPIDEIVSDVNVALPDSIGMTTPHDAPVVRFFHSAQRDHLLTPARWREYEVDALRAGETEFEGELRRRLYQEQVVPYYLKHRHQHPQIEGFPTTLPARRKSVLYTKEEYDDPLIEILKNHDETLSRRGSYKVSYRPQQEIEPGWEREVDLLLLIRSFQQKGVDLLEQALAEGIPVGYFLDDDFLTLHECGPEFDFIAPGTPARRHLTRMLEGADTVWTTSRSINESVRQISPRTIPYNGSVPSESLPTTLRPREEGRPLRIGCTSGWYRQEELSHLWEAFSRFSREYGDRVVFEFWGVDVKPLPTLFSPVIQRPFMHSYVLYLEQLREAGFDVFIAPLLGQPRARLGKAPNKYYLSAVAGALGIFSDVQPYEMLPGGVTCLKVENTVEAWYGALREAAEMPPPRFDLMRRRLLEHVREEFTAAAELNTHEAALLATEFHARTRAKRHEDGRPRVLLYCHPVRWKPDEDELLLRVELLRAYGVEPIVIFHPDPAVEAPSEPPGALARAGVEVVPLSEPPGPAADGDVGGELRSVLERHAPAIVHSFVLQSTLARLCHNLGIAHVATPQERGGRAEWEASFRYCDVLQPETVLSHNVRGRLSEVERVCSRGAVARKLFDVGVRRHLDGLGSTAAPEADPLRIVAVCHPNDSEGHAKALQVLSLLSEKGVKCRLELYTGARRGEEQERCRVGDSPDVIAQEDGQDVDIFQSADLLLVSAARGSFPATVKAAMACGVLVVTTPTAAVTELVIDGVSGILCGGDSPAELAAGVERAALLGAEGRRAMTQQARRVARFEFHPGRAAGDLFRAYNRAGEIVSSDQGQPIGGHGSQSDSDAMCALAEEPAGPPASSVLVANRLKFRLIPRHENWVGLDVLVGTHGRNALGNLRLRLWSPSGELLREVWEDLARVGDNEWLSFRFAAIRRAAWKIFTAEFSLDARGPETRVNLYESSPPDNRVRRLLWRAGRRRPPSESLHCRMWYTA